MDQLVIKALIIAALILIAVVVLLPARGSRGTAFQRLLQLAFFAVAIFAVLFPASLSTIAFFLGVGRGTDLLLYGFIVVFIGNLLANSRRRRAHEREVTVLARAEAIRSAMPPSSRDEVESNGNR